MPKRNHSGVIQHQQKAAEKMVFDDAPRDINIVQFAESRAAEIQALQKYVTAPGGNQQISQKLPIHMRRRAMSHNIKRLPRRLREIAKKEYEKREKALKSKAPSRKHRRRARNLLAEYARRQRNQIWLETHVWHAKRFLMGNKWGYRIPIHPTDKSLRAAYRATKNHCTIQDISYMCCIELVGPQDKLLQSLAHMTSPDIGPTFGAKFALSGTREGQVMLYACDKYPYSFIGCATYLWKPLLLGNDLEVHERKLWVWVHPSCYEELWGQLKIAFKCSDNQDEIDRSETVDIVTKEKSDCGSTPLDAKQTKLKTEHFKHKKLKGKEKEEECDEAKAVLLNRKFETENVRVESLKDCLVRLRLTGPESHAVLGKALDVADILCGGDDNLRWWNTYYSEESTALGFSQQREFWEKVVKCRSQGELLPRSVLGLTIQDPRVRIPDKRTKAIDRGQDVDSDASMDIITPDMSASAIWDPEIRLKVKNSKMTDHQINQLKNDHLLPGTPLQLGADESKIPVLLIQNPGVQQKIHNYVDPPPNYGSGWDLILPSGWSMAFWVAMIYQGARAGGLRELENLSVEQGRFHFPSGYPDCEAGKAEEQRKFEDLSNTYKRKPPAKRPNFRKLGIQLPFQFPWKQIIEEWNKCDNHDHTQSGEFYVLRNKHDLSIISRSFSDVKTLKQKDKTLYRRLLSNAEQRHIGTFSQSISVMSQKHAQSLVAVQVKMVSKGTPDEYSHICIPTQEDLLKLVENNKESGPTENVHLDHTKKKDGKKNLGKTEEVEKSDVIPTVCDHLIRSCSRPVIGYLKEGAMSLCVGQGRGIGFCALRGMMELLQLTDNKMPCIVLIRNPLSYQYRYAYLQLLV